MRFSDPQYLLLMPLMVYWIWRIGNRLLGMTKRKKYFVVALRCVVVLLLILALAGLQMVRENKGVTTVFVLDASDSISESGRKAGEDYIRNAIKTMGANDKAALVLVGKDAVVDMAPTSTKYLPTIYSSPNKTATDLSAGIRLAAALFPDGSARRIVALTDGNETDGDAAQTASALAIENIEIDAVSLASAQPQNETLISEVTAPSDVKVGQPFNIRIIAESNGTATGVIRIDRDGSPVKTIPVELKNGKNAFTAPIQTDKPGFHKYRAVIDTTPDADPRNNEGRAFVHAKGKPLVLLCDDNPKSALQSALSKHEIMVKSVGITGFPSAIHELEQYDSIIFNDYNASHLSSKQMQMLNAAVRDTGIGFIMVGGENSFLPGGYYGTPIAELLPVDLDVRNRKLYPPATVVIVIDISGSMAAIEDGVQKVKVAGQAAIETLKMLRPNDKFGVIVSGTGSSWLAPLQSASNKDAVINLIRSIYAEGGGIYCYPSLKFARDALVGSDTHVKHMILLADGSDCDEQNGCYALAADMLRNGVTITSVALGDGQDVPFLKGLAKIGSGNFYLCRRARDLPKMFTADVSIMTRSAIEEGAFLPKVAADDDILRGIDWKSVPPLLAYDLTSDKPLARNIMKTHNDDPLLATWQFGLGASVAFTSDAQPKWAQRWINWNYFSVFWAQTVRSSLRRSADMRYSLETRREGSKGVMELQAFDAEGNPVNFLQPQVTVTSPSGSASFLTLRQEAPGMYKGDFAIDQLGDYVLTVVEKADNGKPRVYNSAFSIPYPIEYRFNKPNIRLLEKLAEATNGKFAPEPEAAFRPSAKPGVAVADLWQLCLIMAVALFLLDVASRRVVIPVSAVLAFIKNWLNKVKERQSDNIIETEQATKDLLKVKSRVNSASGKDKEKVQQATTASASQASQNLEHQEKTKTQSNPAEQSETALNTMDRLLEVKRKKKE